jgi:hypothetical protein
MSPNPTTPAAVELRNQRQPPSSGGIQVPSQLSNRGGQFMVAETP